MLYVIGEGQTSPHLFTLNLETFIMIDDILARDIKQAINHIESAKAIIDRIYYSEHLIIYFKKVTISLLTTALDFLLSNLKVISIEYAAKLASKKD